MEIIHKFLNYFQSQNHTIVDSSSLVPQGDNSVLLTTAGMQQFKPYYLGQASPFGNRVASSQKCIRVDDIDEIGDDTHLTFFEMVGNFSFNYPDGEGSYFKKEAIRFGYEFIAEVLELPIDYVTIFEGDDIVPRDTESENIWKAIFAEKGVQIEIRTCGREDNFWGPTGAEGPCGPTTEIYVNNVEVWNIVFNQFFQNKDRSLKELELQGVDTGAGFERILVQYEKVASIYDTSLFMPVMNKLKDKLPGLSEEKYRIIADHLRAVLFLISDGVVPSNKDQGYILRRLLRKCIVIVTSQTDGREALIEVGKYYSTLYDERYADVGVALPTFMLFLDEEMSLVNEAMKRGMKHANKILQKKRVPKLSGEEAFILSSTYGLAPELLSLEGIDFDNEEFTQYIQQHKEISRAGSQKKFGGHGLILDNGEIKAKNEEELAIVTRLHSATHLMNQALRDVLGSNVEQAGSDITVERSRFDFTFDRKLSPEEISEVEKIVNEHIQAGLDVTKQPMQLKEAKRIGAIYMANRNYPDEVEVYSFGEYSKELCGGPHVQNTKEIGTFKITKQEAVGRGLRRVRAVVQ
jgi:alanyl-tRNA synthetase